MKIAVIILAVLVLTGLAAWAALDHAIKSAEVGFEDDEGWHPGEPAGRATHVAGGKTHNGSRTA